MRHRYALASPAASSLPSLYEMVWFIKVARHPFAAMHKLVWVYACVRNIAQSGIPTQHYLCRIIRPVFVYVCVCRSFATGACLVYICSFEFCFVVQQNLHLVFCAVCCKYSGQLLTPGGGEFKQGEQPEYRITDAFLIRINIYSSQWLFSLAAPYNKYIGLLEEKNWRGRFSVSWLFFALHHS